jgi:hypothetical protein
MSTANIGRGLQFDVAGQARGGLSAGAGSIETKAALSGGTHS